MGPQVLTALGFESGFTHWSGTARPTARWFSARSAAGRGVRVVDMMNFNTDGDLYVGWAEAVVHGRMPELSNHYNVGMVSKRARGSAGSPASAGWTG